jgi:hypothetical protein
MKKRIRQETEIPDGYDMSLLYHNFKIEFELKCPLKSNQKLLSSVNT